MGWPAILGGAAATLGGSALLGGANKDIASRNRKSQERFAKYGIRWKVADAKAAGINPLVAMGAQTHSFTPSMVGGEDALGSTLKSMGQDITRAGLKQMSQSERHMSQKIAEQNVKRGELQNELLSTQIQQIRSSMNNPSFTEGMKPTQAWGKTPQGGLIAVKSEPMADATEEDMAASAALAANRYISPYYSDKGKPPKNLLPKGFKDWKWNKYQWEPSKVKTTNLYEKYKSVTNKKNWKYIMRGIQKNIKKNWGVKSYIPKNYK